MARRKKAIPQYGTVVLNGIEYYRTRIEDADGKRVALYAKTAEELFEKVEEAKRQIEEFYNTCRLYFQGQKLYCKAFGR